jgi:hypothetical protein
MPPSTIEPRRFRRTRIAVSVFFGVATLLLAVLWVTTVESDCLLQLHTSTRTWEISHFPGDSIWTSNLSLAAYDTMRPMKPLYTGFPSKQPVTLQQRFERIGIDANLGRTLNGFAISIAYPYLIVAFTLPIACVWLPASRRFSLRTMLIATTLLAVALGMLVWAAG